MQSFEVLKILKYSNALHLKMINNLTSLSCYLSHINEILKIQKGIRLKNFLKDF